MTDEFIHFTMAAYIFIHVRYGGHVYLQAYGSYLTNARVNSSVKLNKEMFTQGSASLGR